MSITTALAKGFWWLVLCGAAVSAPTGADLQAVLPPVAPWDGESGRWQVSRENPWVTPAEASGLTTTPDGETTLAWLRRLVEASPGLSLESIGQSPQGRDIWMVRVSARGDLQPAPRARRRRPLALMHAGIHAGEIDGKDAGLMLLRDMTVGGRQAHLLQSVDVLFIPILNVDGHERRSAFGRINQRGPVPTGWRTNARNQNLNRDFSKLDTPEVRALVQVIHKWQPDLYVDLHVTDGMDFQYDITWGSNGAHAHSPAIAAWLAQHLNPAAAQALQEQGHVPGPLFFPLQADDPTRGLLEWTAGPRFSNGYGDARHLPTVLVENHSLKPYRQRVLGTYVLLTSFLETLGREWEALRRAIHVDSSRPIDILPLDWSLSPEPAGRPFQLLGMRPERIESGVTGGEVVLWTGEPQTLQVPWYVSDVGQPQVSAPAAYWIPPEWGEVIERLELHGIITERLEQPRQMAVEMYRFSDFVLDTQPFEGRVRLTAGMTVESRQELLPEGAVRIPTRQPLGRLAMLLLEPDSPDSFFQWGFFLGVLQGTEYAEGYVMEPTARAMMAARPDMAREFEKALEKKDLAADPRARLQWFYRRSPWFDNRHHLYPVAREPAP